MVGDRWWFLGNCSKGERGNRCGSLGTVAELNKGHALSVLVLFGRQGLAPQSKGIWESRMRLGREPIGWSPVSTHTADSTEKLLSQHKSGGYSGRDAGSGQVAVYAISLSLCLI
jgi:hypothetical protein